MTTSDDWDVEEEPAVLTATPKASYTLRGRVTTSGDTAADEAEWGQDAAEAAAELRERSFIEKPSKASRSRWFADLIEAQAAEIERLRARLTRALAQIGRVREEMDSPGDTAPWTACISVHRLEAALDSDVAAGEDGGDG